MTASPMPPPEPLENRAAQVVEQAFGRTLLMWDSDRRRQLPTAVTTSEHFDTISALHGFYDSIVSVGQLGTTEDLPALLGDLRRHLAPHSIVHFCEPTISTDDITSKPPHDVTTALWASGLTVVQCRRFRARRRLRIHQYCWGMARLTPRR